MHELRAGHERQVAHSSSGNLHGGGAGMCVRRGRRRGDADETASARSPARAPACDLARVLAH
eukprot:16409-Pleurochrysis_carterae.AAC.1